MLKRTSIALLILLSFGSVNSLAQLTFTQYMLGALRARHIGPAVMGGRISDVAVCNTNPARMYVGAAGGGLWKSTNAGVTFTPVFEDHPQSIGALAVDHEHPDTLWVGTGEPWTRNSVSMGKGLYRTVDGGKTWSMLGFEKSERIARIAINPKNPAEVYVAVLGALFSDSEERGLYKTSDFGKTWKRLLYTNEKSGCADVVLSPSDPSIVMAAMWQMRRTAWSFSSGGEGSGLFKSTNSGESFEPCVNGLPITNVGRIALDISASNSNVMYANVESEKTALYKSDNAGESWTSVFDGVASSLRPFYFSRLVVDPQNADVVLKTGLNLYRSEDGGKTFETIFGSAHSDHHAIWVDPKNSAHIVSCTDGGIYESYDKGKSARFLNSLPISQFYHVTVDMAEPYNVYGGLQDNGSWKCPNTLNRGIGNSDWLFVGGGDGFHVVSDFKKPELVYWEYQGGNMFRTNIRTEEAKSIRPPDPSAKEKLRFNWNTPIAMGRANPGNLYVGSQFLHKSTDRGDSWKTISSDLTTNDSSKLKQADGGGLTLDNSSAENHCTVITISESPFDEKILFVGTDDGNLQLTTNGGTNWTNVVGNVTGLPKNTWVSCIEPSVHDRKTFFVTFDGHMHGDMATYLYKTTDLGKTFSSIASTDIVGYAHVIRQDPKAKQLLFLGTEFGLYLSLDEGASWLPFKNEVPQVSIRDAVIHPRDNDLVLATHGRGVIVIDNIEILRALASVEIVNNVHIIPTKPAVRRIGGMGGWFQGENEYQGNSEDRSPRVWYVLKDRHLKGSFSVTIQDPQGKTIRKVPASTRKGLNSIELPLRMPAPLTASSEVSMAGGTFTGPLLQEGVYTIHFDKNGEHFQSEIKVVTDTMYGHTVQERALQQSLVWELYNLNEELAITTKRIQDALGEVTEAKSRQGLSKELLTAGESVFAVLDSLNKALVNTKLGFVTGEEQLREELAELYGSVNGYMGKPTESQQVRTAALTSRVRIATEQAEQIIGEPLAKLNSDLQAANQPLLQIPTREQTEARMRKH
ncbi:MAG: glycosyl hydrolase [Ignavibacteria bacterium]|nr:glycosyl hydrolase [Ignavibacteria bacterium]